MSKVYLVHAESGEYSDWTFEPKAVFTTCESAVAWIEAQRFRVVDDYGELVVDNGWRYISDDEETVGYTRPTNDGDGVWRCRSTLDGRRVDGDLYNDYAWFVDELELDPIGGGA